MPDTLEKEKLIALFQGAKDLTALESNLSAAFQSGDPQVLEKYCEQREFLDQTPASICRKRQARSYDPADLSKLTFCFAIVKRKVESKADMAKLLVAYPSELEEKFGKGVSVKVQPGMITNDGSIQDYETANEGTAEQELYAYATIYLQFAEDKNS